MPVPLDIQQSAPPALLAALQGAGMELPYGVEVQTDYWEGRNTLKVWGVTRKKLTADQKNETILCMVDFLNVFKGFEYEGIDFCIDLANPEIEEEPL